MEKINLFFKINTKIYCEIIPKDSTINSLYDIIELKSNTEIRKSHVFKINGKIVQDNKKLTDYNISPNTTIDVQFSLSKCEKNRDPDIEGEMIFNKLVNDIGHNCGIFDVNIVSLMSYNVDMTNINKIFLQQLQWPILGKELKRLDLMSKDLEGLVNINIILPDRNFISYNNNPIASNEDSFLNSSEKINKQIDSICDIKKNTSFTKNAHEYNYRVSKYSVMLQNFKLKKLFEVSSSLQKIVQLNFYYVGIIFEKIEFNNSEKNIVYGFDFTPLKPYNLHVHVWTGEKII